MVNPPLTKCTQGGPLLHLLVGHLPTIDALMGLRLQSLNLLLLFISHDGVVYHAEVICNRPENCLVDPDQLLICEARDP